MGRKKKDAAAGQGKVGRPEHDATEPAAGSTSTTTGDGRAAPVGWASRNEVTLVGRVAAPAQERELPSGDLLASWRVVVDRPAPTRPVPEGLRLATVDTLDCVAWGPAERETALALSAGDVVSVAGALRRRFWRAGAAAASRCEVEVVELVRLDPVP